MKKIIGAMSMAVIMAGCGNSGEAENNAPVVPVTDTPTTQPNVVYERSVTAGYAGVLPCADCDGIESELRLYTDTTFELVTKYLNKNPKDTAGLNTTKTGRFMMHTDTVHLEGVESKYLKTDTAVLQLDKSGKF